MKPAAIALFIFCVLGCDSAGDPTAPRGSPGEPCCINPHGQRGRIVHDCDSSAVGGGYCDLSTRLCVAWPEPFTCGGRGQAPCASGCVGGGQFFLDSSTATCEPCGYPGKPTCRGD